jgi:hypothetical protein
MINKMVYKEEIKAIQCIMMRKIIRDPGVTIDMQEVSSTSNGLERNDLNIRLPPLITFQLYCSHSSIRIMLIVMGKPIDQHTGMRFVMVIK